MLITYTYDIFGMHYIILFITYLLNRLLRNLPTIFSPKNLRKFLSKNKIYKNFCLKICLNFLPKSFFPKNLPKVFTLQFA